MEDVNEVRAFLVEELDGMDAGDADAPPWAPFDMGSAADCWVVKTETNGVFIDADVVGKTIMFSMMHVQHQRQGFGTAVLEAMAKFAKQRDLAIQVSGVHNTAFFDTIDWLDGNYRSKFGPPDPYASDD